MNEYIYKYIEQEFAVFPCLKSTKTPLKGSDGFYDASNNLETVQQLFYDDTFLIGLPTGQRNGIAVIDIDQGKTFPKSTELDPRTVQEIGEEVVNNYGPLPDTFQVETPSGGRHLYYLLPEDVEIPSASRFLDKTLPKDADKWRTLPVDIRADGGYIIAPDGIGYIVYDDVDNLEIENLKSRCAVLPQWVIDIRQKRQEVNPENLPDLILPESEIREIRSALSFISSDDRDTWIRMGMALKSSGSSAAYGLWNEWSKTSSKYNPHDMEKRWTGLKPSNLTIASVFHEAKQYGWTTTYEKKSGNQEINIVSSYDEDRLKEIRESFKKKPFPVELLEPPGLIGEMMQYILERSIVPQPIFALSASLCAVGALAGRKVQTDTGIRTNIYCLNVGESGSGKEGPRKAIKNLFYQAGCGRMASVEDLASDAAIITSMSETNSQIFLLDEIGRFLETTKKGSTHLYNVVSVLLKMYSSSDQTFYGKDYADSKNKREIVQPNLCLLGTTVPDTLYKGLTYESATDGFLSRMLIFETDDNRPRKKRRGGVLAKPSKRLIEQVKMLKSKPINVNPEGNLDVELRPEPQIVRLSEDAIDMIECFDDYIYDLRDNLSKNGKIDAIYNRTAQLAEQIALILAVGVNIDSPVISDLEMSYGIQLAKYLADHMNFIVENFMAKNEYEHEVKRVLNIIRKVGTISMSDLIRETQNLPGHTRADVLNTLNGSNQIQKSFVSRGEYVIKMITAI